MFVQFEIASRAGCMLSKSRSFLTTTKKSVGAMKNMRGNRVLVLFGCPGSFTMRFLSNGTLSSIG
ncbi:hypothetical protein VL21_08900 [Stenotrophomonas maltophilia]|nr:hypothetical protein B7H26_17865 [Stenotrophomonas maltophilia]KOO86400.1 hypothetical protein VL21_08900 [Stenotrophomonas maltophilia]OWQ71117.1 hypothetical protein CEE56_10970 [Stenotrophomonas maltophilia]